LSLKQILAQVPNIYEAVRYELHNLIAPTDFVEHDFDRYSELCEKAVVNPDFKLTHGDFVESIIQGELNFFDVPFDSKVIFRLPQNSWAAAGSHSLLKINSDREYKLSEETTFVAHIPFLTRERLVRRAERGRTLVSSGYPRDHGWQSQVVYQMQIGGRLDDYWKKNSIPNTSSNSVFSPPKTITDNRLAPVLEAAISELLPSLNDMEDVFAIQQSAREPSVTLSEGVHAVHAMAQYKQEGIDAAFTHIENLQFEIDQLTAQREAFLNSISWRVTRSLRLIDKTINRWHSKFGK
jgi:hypothetical protein